MKKMFKTKLALLLVAAALLTGGTFTSCSDGGESSGGDRAVEALPAPEGKDPFKSGCYSLKDNHEWYLFEIEDLEEEYGEDGDCYMLFSVHDYSLIKFNTSARTMELLDEDKKVDNSSIQFKYTYSATDKTVTLALSKVAVPEDISKYIQSYIKDGKYAGSWKLVSLSEYKKAIDTLYANESFREYLIEEGENPDDVDEVMTWYENAFSTPLVYSYTVNEDESISLELTSPKPVHNRLGTTLQFVVE
ncbi:MAG: hypothetical protein J1D88_01190 [Treponema sp.]|nr:hypothetical protein [Treponema sp.]